MPMFWQLHSSLTETFTACFNSMLDSLPKDLLKQSRSFQFRCFAKVDWTKLGELWHFPRWHFKVYECKIETKSFGRSKLYHISPGLKTISQLTNHALLKHKYDFGHFFFIRENKLLVCELFCNDNDNSNWFILNNFCCPFFIRTSFLD